MATTTAEDDEIARLMGFTAFGAAGANKRARQQTREQQHALAQVVPGTELDHLLASDARAAAGHERLEQGAHGVVYLVSEPPDADAGRRLAALLLRRSSEGEERKTDAQMLPAYSHALLQELQEQKNQFDALESAAFRRARSAANAFERIGRGRFLNRSAMKLVNIDHVFQLTAVASLKTPPPSLSSTATFAFADVCGGPGGFSEYLLWRVPQREPRAQVCGFGISLRDEVCDWKLPPLAQPSPSTLDSASPIESTAPVRTVTFDISYGADGTGDLYRVANIHDFRDVVLAKQPFGVDVVVADGGFQDARDQSDQEQRMLRLVLAEVLTMFMVLKARGSFVVKTFEVSTPAMLQLVWLLHQCFAKLTVVKPVTSRPASSERYVVALDRHERLPVDAIVAALEARLTDPELRLDQLVHAAAVRDDSAFVTYMAAVSDCFARAQIAACRRILALAAARSDGSKRKRRDSSEWVDTRSYHTCWDIEDAS